MFDPSSRYASIAVATITVLDREGVSREVHYVQRRFIPSSEGTTSLLEHSVTQGDRLDNITARYLSDPTQFWRVCDANNVLRPGELTETLGRAIKIAAPLT